jgi:hypothetical protein
MTPIESAYHLDEVVAERERQRKRADRYERALKEIAALAYDASSWQAHRAADIASAALKESEDRG